MKESIKTLKTVCGFCHAGCGLIVETIDGKIRKIKARYQHFDFSSHCGASQLKDALRQLGGKPKVFVVHGAEGNCELFANWAKSELGLDAVAPKTGETFEV